MLGNGKQSICMTTLSKRIYVHAYVSKNTAVVPYTDCDPGLRLAILLLQ